MADKKFTVTFDANMDVSEVKKSVSEVQKAFNSINMSKGMSAGIGGTFKKLLEELDNYNNLTSQAQSSVADIKKADKSLSTIVSLIEKVNEATKEIGENPLNFIDAAELKKINSAKKAIEQAKQAISNTAVATKKTGIKEQYDEARKKAQKLTDQVNQLNGKISEKKTTKNGIEVSLEETRKTLKTLKSELAALEANPVKLQTKTTQKKGVKTTENLNSDAVEEYKNKLTDTKTRIGEVETSISQLEKKLQGADTSKMESELEEVSAKANEATQAMNDLAQKLEGVTKVTREEAISRLKDELADLTGVAKSELPQSIEKLEEFVEELGKAEKTKIDSALEKIGNGIQQIKSGADQGAISLNKVNDQVKELSRADQDIEGLKNRILDFFSISNVIQIFKDAIRDAFETVKELDAAMTETAVVTDFSIGDMWEKLPEYSAQATKLGTSIKSLYEATTLYYQQGLNSEQAMSVGIETMKMARIANMDAAQATEAMTAALRGFNMEINETSATRINDVYSELAAITASDTEQIATAMSKTASIAASANMEFETTAALLAQIIETTQEAPETAGTAMKTIIARFTEVKELFSEGMLTGEDSEGEEININKIDAALKTVGISLKDFLNGAKGIDDIFLELASKWGDLDLATQRYIATAAAGSRQQSRFIAMMSNYDRTMELVTAANNSAGASQKQFDKTLESLEAKLQRLKNAWAEFTMGLANSEVIKVVVDLLTNLLEQVNKLTSLTGNEGIGGIITMFVRLTTVIAALKSSKTILSGFSKAINSIFGKSETSGDFAAKWTSDKMGIFQSLFVNKLATKGVYGKFSSETKSAEQTLQVLKKTLGVTEVNASSLLTVFAKFTGYAAVFSLIAVAVSKVANSFKEAQKQTQLDNLSEIMADLTEQSEQANQELSNISNQKSGLENLHKTLEGLTKGTEDWKKALFETNNEVLNLVDKYPILADYIEYGSSGEMFIKESGWDALLEQQEKVTSQLANAKLAISTQQSELQKGLTFEQFVTTSGVAYAGTDRQKIDWGAVGYNYGLLSQAAQNYEVVDVSQLKDMMVEDTEQSQLEEALIKASIKMANWMDSGAGKYMTAINDGYLNADPAAQAGKYIGDQIAKAMGYDPVTSTPYQEQHDKIESSGGYSKNLYEDLIGITEEQYMALADAFYQSGIVISDDLSTDTFNAIYNSLSLPSEALDRVREAAYSTASEFNSLAQSVGEYNAAQDRTHRQFINNSLTGNSELEGVDYLNELANIINATVDYDTMLSQERQKVAEEANKQGGKSIKQQYADLFGGYVDAEGKLYTDKTRQTEVTLDDAGLTEAIASANLQEIFAKVGEKMVGSFETAEVDTKLLKQLFSIEGTSITDELLKNYAGEGELDLSKVLADLNFTGEDAFVEFVDKFGQNAGQLLLENFNMAADRITKTRVDLAKKMRRSNGDYKSTFNSEEEYIASELKRLEDSYGTQIRDTLSSIFSKLGEAGDQALIDAGYQKFMEISQTGSAEDLQDINDFVEGVDWTNPIQAAKQLNNEIENGTQVTKEYAAALLSVGSSALDGGAQMRYFIQSADFSDMKEDLQDIIDEQGEISAMDVLDLADSYEELNDIMENTEATAAGLAEIFEQLVEGGLEIDQVTDVVMAATSGIESLDSYVSNVLKTLEEYDWGTDENEVNEFISDMYEDALVPHIEAGRYNNDELNTAMDTILGAGWDEKLTGEERIDTMVAAAKEIKKYTETGDFSNFFDALSKGKTILGEEANVDNGPGGKYEGLKVVDNGGGSYSLVGYENYTEEDIENYFKEAGGTSSLMASMAMVDLRQHDYAKEMDRYFSLQDLDKGLASAYEEAESTRTYELNDLNGEKVVTYGEKKVFDQSEIDAIKSLYDDEYSDDIQSYFNQNGLITNFYDEDGLLKSTEDIVGELNKVFTQDVNIGKEEGEQIAAKWIDGFTTETEGGKKIVDWDQLSQGLENSNVPESIRTTVAESMIQGLEEGTMVDITLSDGTTQQVEVTPNFDYDATVAKLEKQVASSELKDTITEAIQSAFGVEDLTINFTESSAKELTDAINAAIPKDVPVSAVYEPDLSNLPSELPPVYQPVYYKYPEGEGENPEQFATGIKNSPRDYDDSLVGEGGPELIQKANGGAYLSGLNGPEIVDIEKGDTVYTAEETKKIYAKRNHSMIPRYEGGKITGYGNGTSLSGGSSSDDDDEDVWENGFDKLYNLVRKINEELHQRERIERRYEKLLENIDVSANQIISVSREELAQLQREAMLQKKLIAEREAQISDYQAENSDLTQYASVVQNDNGESVLRINWDLINSVTDSDEGDRIDDYISQLEEWTDSLEEAEEALWDIEDAVDEIKERGEEEYFNLEDAIKEALSQSYQDEIDELSKINDSINDTNSSLLDAIQKSLDKQRQDRDNQRTEDELAEKQRRLLYLQQDTSGANAMEILQLQKEIEEGQEDYTDTLIDQKISELQDQNEEAAAQRNQQITLLQAQLDQYLETGHIWNDVYDLMDEGLDKDTGLVRGSRLEDLLKSADGYKGMSEISKMEWLNDTNNMIAQALAYLEIGRQLEDIGVGAGTEIEFTTSDGRVLTGTVNSDGSVLGSDGKTYNNVFQGYDGKYYAGENIADVEEPTVEGNGSYDGGGSTTTTKSNPYGVASNQGNYTVRNKTQGTYMSGTGVKAIQWALDDMGYNVGSIDGIYGYATHFAVQAFQSDEGISADGDFGPDTREKMRLRGYKTGGLADFTGPAWLDGTKARPELVLNAKDTQNFIQLKDILASVMERGSTSNTSTENNGDITYDIDINVESIGSDYDVEQVANKIKSMIGDNARYRNNNTVSLAR